MSGKKMEDIPIHNKFKKEKKKRYEAEGSRTPNLEIWSLTQCHYATAPFEKRVISIEKSNFYM